MTEREKLIELCKEAHASYLNDEHAPAEYSPYLADHLLSNGVIVIPCKVGDTVYQTDGIRIYELEILDISLRKNKPYYETESIDFDNDAIGKTVFLTEEEAEKALKERSEGR